MEIVKELTKYQPSSEGGTRSPPAMLNHLKNPKWPLGGPKLATPMLLGTPVNFWKNKFFDPSTPSMRKVDNGGKQAGAELCQAQHSLC